MTAHDVLIAVLMPFAIIGFAVSAGVIAAAWWLYRMFREIDRKGIDF